LPRTGSRSNIVTLIAIRDQRLCDCPAIALRTFRLLRAQLYRWFRPPRQNLSRNSLLKYPPKALPKTLPEIFNCRATGGRGRIRTSVARKERQIYSLLVLATHPPVPETVPKALPPIPPTALPIPMHLIVRKNFSGESEQCFRETQKGLVSRDTSPFIFPSRIRSASSPRNFLVELAEGIEPPTL
jgi:hypothetical protein